MYMCTYFNYLIIAYFTIDFKLSIVGKSTETREEEKEEEEE